MGGMLDRIFGLAGYRERPQSCAELNRLEYAVCRAAAEMMYPKGLESWPSHEDAGMLTEISDYLKAVVPRKRRLLFCLFVFTELFPLSPPTFRRFTRLNPERRQRLLEGWDNSRLLFFSLCGSSLRMLFNLAYVSSDKAKERIGETPRAECRQTVRPHPLARQADGSSEGVLEYPALQGRRAKDEADFLVIGSGPAGATVARELAEAGRSVVLLERGPFYRPEEHGTHAMRVLRDLYCEQGLRHTKGNAPIRTFQAHALGGTSLVNSAICWRAPQYLFDQWREKFGIEGLSRQTLDPHYERCERNLSVAPVEPAVYGRKAELFRDGCNAMRVEGRPMRRATPGCRGCSECFYGCPTNAKASMDRTYIPAAIEHGARVYTSARAEVLVYDKGRIAGAYARVLGPDGKPTGGEVAVWAKATVLAAGVLASPVLLRKSNPPYLSDAVGKNLCFHNGIAVAGVFDQEVNPWVGATQGWDTDVYIPDGIHMEVLWVNSAILMSRTRGFGEPLRRAMGELRRTAYWCIAIRGTSRGTVKAGRDWEPRLRFDLNDTDVGLLKRGMDLLVDHFFAAGARCVRPGLAGFDSEIRTPAQVEALKRLTTVQARQIVPSGNHVFGTCAMGADRKRSVVDSHCEAYDLPDLYICDTGIFPTPSAVNPQLTVMAMASRLAETLRKRY